MVLKLARYLSSTARYEIWRVMKIKSSDTKCDHKNYNELHTLWKEFKIASFHSYNLWDRKWTLWHENSYEFSILLYLWLLQISKRVFKEKQWQEFVSAREITDIFKNYFHLVTENVIRTFDHGFWSSNVLKIQRKF